MSNERQKSNIYIIYIYVSKVTIAILLNCCQVSWNGKTDSKVGQKERKTKKKEKGGIEKK